MESSIAPQDQKFLLELARKSIVSYVTDQEVPPVETNRKELCSTRGCFVTITAGGDLRGCIGNFISDKPLYRLVQEMAVSAAVRDPRFYPMQQSDLRSFELEISVLSPLRKISTVEEIEVGIHGIYLEKNYSRGVLLPQVAVEYGWDRDTFLGQTCLKAGLRHNDWQDGADIFIFSAQIFRETM
jgi:AmmeMemoRadiSam system protein A